MDGQRGANGGLGLSGTLKPAGVARRTDLQNDKDGAQALSFAIGAVNARYLRITAKCLNPIEKGKPGQGMPGGCLWTRWEWNEVFVLGLYALAREVIW
jgi:hypothetical protein